MALAAERFVYSETPSFDEEINSAMPRKYLWLLVIVLLIVSWQWLRTNFTEHERQARTQVRDSVAAAFPEMASEAQERFAIRRLSSPAANGREVLLLHGLDDPGQVWMNLAPVLAANGHGVLQLDYPNDQSVAESARFLAQQLEELGTEGVSRVELVAHSMGGLVSRELLTSPGLACEAPVCVRPQVSRLIMVGTPNHGSDLARFRALGEVREQVSRLFGGEAGWLDWIFDGAGEAGLDLLPGSAFLRELNARPQPEGVRMLVIAGEIGKEQWDTLDALLQQHTGELPQALREARQHLGDGLVSVDSARLPSVPLVRVPGNHLSIIRNVSVESTRMPPAIPIILQQLGDGEEAPGQQTGN